MTSATLLDDMVAWSTPMHTPEAVTVLVATSDRDIASAVGPMLAERIYPGQHFGETVWVGEADAARAGFTEVAVRRAQKGTPR
jgi:hypothetical protein